MARRNRALEKSSMHPTKHPEVSQLLEEDNLHFKFHDNDDDIGCTKTYDTNIMGRFRCYNPKCTKNGWSSKQISITIRMYPRREYNAVVWHQRCKSCGFLAKPILDETYADRVAYRIKKWCGIRLEKRVYSGNSKGPHESRLCEGCKAGHCSQGDEVGYH
ncbi:zinc-binding domain-containing protein [Xylaria cf. heliscus]|nr:zinc-binding domain-containing protein [Xylaria cf. heliscus]